VIVVVLVSKEVRRTTSVLLRRVMSLERLRGLADRLTTVERTLTQLTAATRAISAYTQLLVILP